MSTKKIVVLCYDSMDPETMELHGEHHFEYPVWVGTMEAEHMAKEEYRKQFGCAPEYVKVDVVDR